MFAIHNSQEPIKYTSFGSETLPHVKSFDSVKCVTPRRANHNTNVSPLLTRDYDWINTMHVTFVLCSMLYSSQPLKCQPKPKKSIKWFKLRTIQNALLALVWGVCGTKSWTPQRGSHMLRSPPLTSSLSDSLTHSHTPTRTRARSYALTHSRIHPPTRSYTWELSPGTLKAENETMLQDTCDVISCSNWCFL